MQYLKADTNTEVLIGPAVAVGDAFTPVTTLSLSTADEAEIIKYGGATPLTVTSISANGFAAITGADGYYTLDITTGNSDTEGFLTVLINDDSLILPIRVDFMVVNANVYDSLFAAAATDYLQTDVAQWLGTAAATPTTAGVPTTALSSIGLDDIVQSATGMVEIAKAIWDRVLSKANHNIAQSAGKRVRGIDDAFEVHAGTAQAGTTGTITLDTGASATDDIYRGDRCVIVAGTGAGEHGLGVSYNGTTKVLTMAENWVVTPDATSEFVLVPADVDIETWAHNVVTSADVAIESTTQLVDDFWDEPIAGHLTAGTAGLSEALGSAALVDSTVTGTPTATTFDFTGGNTNADFYADQLVYILSGTGIGQVRPILSSSYSGGTTTITVDEAFVVTPAASDRFAVLVSHVHPKTQITADIVADPVIAELTTQGDTNEAKLDTINGVVDAILVDTASLGVTKNAAFSNFEFLMVDATDYATPETGLTVTGQRSIDGAAFAAVSGTIAEVGSGIYQFDALAADTNGNVITWKFSSAGAADRYVTIKTRA